MSKKKNNVAIVWPSNTHFTMGDLFKQYPSFVEITLRFRVKRGLENKEIVTIGKVKPPIGRPQLVFARANPTKELLDVATSAGVLPLTEEKKTVIVGDVKTPVKKVKIKEVVSEVASVDVSLATETSTV